MSDHSVDLAQMTPEQLEEHKASLLQQIAVAESQLDNLQSDYETRRKSLDDELKGILTKTLDAVARLKAVQEAEKSTRAGIADQIKLLGSAKAKSKQLTSL